MSQKFYGSIVAIVTPMDAAGAIDYAALRALLEWHINEGADGVVIAGTTGESPTLLMDEHQRLVAETVKIVDGRLPVIAGTGSNNTQEAVILTRHAQKDGADACLSVVPYYNKPTQEGLYRHYAAIADACDLPMILYDVPGRTITALSDDVVARLSALPGIVGIKDATGDVGRVSRLRQMIAREDFTQLSGDDSTCCDYMLEGGHGVISVTANVAPKNMAAMARAATSGQAEAARRLDAAMQAFHKMQGVEGNPIPVKAALFMAGKMPDGIRLPLLPLSQQHRDAVQAAAAQAASEVADV